LMAHPLTEATSGPPTPVEALVQESMLVRNLYARCDYAGALHRLVGLISVLHGSKRKRAALEQIVPVYGAAMGCLINVGYAAQAWLAVDRCMAAARSNVLCDVLRGLPGTPPPPVAALATNLGIRL
jgi:hypothetical protein